VLEHKITLTKRQLQLIKHICNGGSTRSFAERFNLSIKTVEAHRYTLMQQIDCHNVAQVIKYAIKFGYCKLGIET
jgi:DNA-binding CsgD family transcriptional regulator